MQPFGGQFVVAQAGIALLRAARQSCRHLWPGGLAAARCAAAQDVTAFYISHYSCQWSTLDTF